MSLPNYENVENSNNVYLLTHPNVQYNGCTEKQQIFPSFCNPLLNNWCFYNIWTIIYLLYPTLLQYRRENGLPVYFSNTYSSRMFTNFYKRNKSHNLTFVTIGTILKCNHMCDTVTLKSWILVYWLYFIVI